MHLGVLQTGKVNPSLAGQFEEYPRMFEDMYRAVDPGVHVTGFAAVDGEIPLDPHACEAWIVTGSKHGVYDDQPWIEPLKVFLREVRDAGVPLVGICFGHQIMAEAFGGRAEKSDKGWGCGVHRYAVTAKPGWMGSAGAGFDMHAMHQDQVTALPEDAHVLASSDFCPNAMLGYGDAEAPEAISIQPHPEFDADYMRAILELRAGVAIPPDRAEPALDGLGAPVDGLDFARWSLDYIRQMQARRRAA